MPLVTYRGTAGIFAAHDIGSPELADHYARQGWAVIRGFFPSSCYADVHAYINHLLDLKLAEAGLSPSSALPVVRTEDYLRLCSVDRAKGGEIYRACRQLLPLHRMATSEPVIALAKSLMKADFINSNPYTALRIDRQDEQKYLFEWHQDYPYTQGSLDGIVIWGSLFPLLEGDGGIKLIPGSHRWGLQKVEITDPLNANRNGAHSIRIVEGDRFDQETAIRVDLEAGDILAFSTLLLHKSVPAERSSVRWTFQIRHSNFSNSDSVRRGWPGGAALGDRFEVLHPEFVAAGERH